MHVNYTAGLDVCVCACVCVCVRAYEDTHTRTHKTHTHTGYWRAHDKVFVKVCVFECLYVSMYI